MMSLQVFTLMFTYSFYGMAVASFYTSANIPYRQRQIIHILSEVHILIIFQVAQDIFYIEEIAN